jgi:hypothetical protein
VTKVRPKKNINPTKNTEKIKNTNRYLIHKQQGLVNILSGFSADYNFQDSSPVFRGILSTGGELKIIHTQKVSV